MSLHEGSDETKAIINEFLPSDFFFFFFLCSMVVELVCLYYIQVYSALTAKEVVTRENPRFNRRKKTNILKNIVLLRFHSALRP